MTLGVWWYGVHLLATSLIWLEKSRRTVKSRFVCLFFSFLFAGFAFDEMASVHERLLGDWITIVLLFTVGGILFSYVNFRLYRKGNQKTAAAILLGIGVMVLAVPLEYLAHNWAWPSSLVGLRIGIEEGCEVFGGLICLVAVVRERDSRYWPNPISRVIPNLKYTGYAYYIPFVLTCAHLIISYFVFLYIDVSMRGNPAVFIPSLLFLIVSSICFWNQYSIESGVDYYWKLCTVTSFFISFLSYYLLSPVSTIKYFVLVGSITPYTKIYLYYTICLVLYILLYNKIDSKIHRVSMLLLIVGFAAVYSLFGYHLVNYYFAGLYGVYLIYVLSDTDVIGKLSTERIAIYNRA